MDPNQQQPQQPSEPAQQAAPQPQNPAQPTDPSSVLPQGVQTTPPAASNTPWYRKYWTFGVIFLFVPLGWIWGVYILLSGDVVKSKDGQEVPISRGEKITLIIIAVVIQGIFIASNLTTE